jgi:hypothetical protein
MRLGIYSGCQLIESRIRLSIGSCDQIDQVPKCLNLLVKFIIDSDNVTNKSDPIKHCIGPGNKGKCQLPKKLL